MAWTHLCWKLFCWSWRFAPLYAHDPFCCYPFRDMINSRTSRYASGDSMGDKNGELHWQLLQLLNYWVFTPLNVLMIQRYHPNWLFSSFVALQPTHPFLSSSFLSHQLDPPICKLTQSGLPHWVLKLVDSHFPPMINTSLLSFVVRRR